MTENFNFTQCNIDKNCWCQGLACVHCSFMLWHMYPHFLLKLKYIDCYIHSTFSVDLGLLWSWSCGSWIYNYLCNQCLSPLMLWVRISIRVRCTTLCDQVCQWLATGQWFSPGPPVSSTNKTDRQDITEILLKVAINTIKQTYKPKQLYIKFE